MSAWMVDEATHRRTLFVDGSLNWRDGIDLLGWRANNPVKSVAGEPKAFANPAFPSPSAGTFCRLWTYLIGTTRRSGERLVVPRERLVVLRGRLVEPKGAMESFPVDL